MKFDCREIDIITDLESQFEVTAQGIRLSHDQINRFWKFEEIESILPRNPAGRSTALEIFFIDGSSVFLDFYPKPDIDTDTLVTLDDAELNKLKALESILTIGDKQLIHLDQMKTENPKEWLKMRTDFWQRGLISNFQYLLDLNTISGRSFKNISLYPFFPWVLQDYISKTLDLRNPCVFRDLSTPIGYLGETNKSKARDRYAPYLRITEGEPYDPSIVPFYHGKYVMTSAVVAHYLLRISPYTEWHIKFQGGTFDHADRLFSDVAMGFLEPRSYQEKMILEDLDQDKEITGSTESFLESLGYDSLTRHLTYSFGEIETSDELIPEFYYFSDFLLNKRELDFGITQSRKSVDTVKLPPWADNQPSKFTRLMKDALESRVVSEGLQDWIDLHFGYLQKGKRARRKHNLYYDIFYRSQRELRTELHDGAIWIITLENDGGGILPEQLFVEAHPQRDISKIKRCVYEYDSVSFDQDEIMVSYVSYDLEKREECFGQEDLQYFRNIEEETILHFLIRQLKDNLQVSEIEEIKRLDKIIKKLISKYPELLNTRDSQGRTPLLSLIEIGDQTAFNLAKELVVAGANPNVMDRQRRSPLHELIQQLILSKNQKSIAPAEIEEKEDYDEKDSFFESEDEEDSFSILESDDYSLIYDSDSSFEESSYEDSRGTLIDDDAFLEMIGFLLKRGANLNALDLERRTPLFYAVDVLGEVGVDLVELLIDYGADLDVKDCRGESLALHLVEYHEDIVKIFIKHGVSPESILDHVSDSDEYTEDMKHLLETYQRVLEYLPDLEIKSKKKRAIIGRHLLELIAREGIALTDFERLKAIDFSSLETLIRKDIPGCVHEQTDNHDLLSFSSTKVVFIPQLLDLERLQKILKNEEDMSFLHITSAKVFLSDTQEIDAKNIFRGQYKEIIKERIQFQSGEIEYYPDKNEIHLLDYQYETFSDTGRLILKAGANEVDISKLNKKYWRIAWRAMDELGIKVSDGSYVLDTCPILNQKFFEVKIEEHHLVKEVKSRKTKSLLRRMFHL